MNFKFNGNVFKNTAEDHQRIYGQNYDPSKNYPGFTGTIEIPKSQLQEFVTYLHYACQTQLKYNDYLKEEVVPVRMSGWAKQAESTGRTYLGISFEPDNQTKLAAQQAQQAEAATAVPAAAPAPAPIDQAAQSLAKATGGDVLF
jgi:hypothetical protein